MNYREPPQLPVRARRALHCLSLLLLPALAPDSTLAAMRPRLPRDASADSSQPYLPAVGAPPLRFQQPPTPPPDLVMRPPAAAPPSPALTVEESSVALENAAAARSTSVRETSETSPPEMPRNTETSPAANGKPPRPILQDHVRPQVRPEDFLPFFQLPGAANNPDVTVIVPAPRAAPTPGSMPNSSATYTQTPK